MSVAIKFENVSKHFALHHTRPRAFKDIVINLFKRPRHDEREEFWALKDVSFEVESGETVGIIGPNGVGKSTTLKIASRVIEPTSGHVEVNGNVRALLELGTGFHPDLTGRENIYLNASIMGIGRKQIDACFDDIVEFSELESFIDAPVKRYSSGMYVRLAFSVAVHTNPEVLLVDEVLAVGDQNFQRKCMDRIYEMKQSGTTILLVSHGLEGVTRLCQRAIWLNEGQVVEDGPARDVVESYLVEINARDRERLERESQSNFGEGADDLSTQSTRKQVKRSGSGEIRIQDVSFLDANGEASEVFISGQPLTIRIIYEVSQYVENPVFGIGLHRDDNIHVAGPNTLMGGYPISHVEGSGVLDFVIPSLPLMAGHYEISVSAYDEAVSHKYDYWHRAFSFSVQPRSPWDTLGITRLPGHWVMRSNP